MDVGDRSSLAPLAGTLGTEAPVGIRSGPSSAAGTSAGRAADRSEVSTIARTLASAAEQPSIRQDLVTELQQRIASGTYAVAPHDVASALLHNLGT